MRENAVSEWCAEGARIPLNRNGLRRVCNIARSGSGTCLVEGPRELATPCAPRG